ncbi:hypothetical protein AVEN_94989-1 [Araneus ventricosus]|uniref:Uncharacterized protein n=1 Tax=Araneus ventricosus TaxID=182803 RepID=A0A4Y2NV69_ARAVE|nr:hypothetical protein AVEN_94989-1 [Araneus ventricosus]
MNSLVGKLESSTQGEYKSGGRNNDLRDHTAQILTYYTEYQEVLRLKAIISPKSRNFNIQEIQMSLQDNLNIKVGWVKAHTVIAGIEAADKMAKKATKEGPKFEIPAP